MLPEQTLLIQLLNYKTKMYRVDSRNTIENVVVPNLVATELVKRQDKKKYAKSYNSRYFVKATFYKYI
jgi:hypothetical protein